MCAETESKAADSLRKLRFSPQMLGGAGEVRQCFNVNLPAKLSQHYIMQALAECQIGCMLSLSADTQLVSGTTHGTHSLGRAR